MKQSLSYENVAIIDANPFIFSLLFGSYNLLWYISRANNEESVRHNDKITKTNDRAAVESRENDAPTDKFIKCICHDINFLCICVSSHLLIYEQMAFLGFPFIVLILEFRAFRLLPIFAYERNQVFTLRSCNSNAGSFTFCYFLCIDGTVGKVFR